MASSRRAQHIPVRIPQATFFDSCYFAPDLSAIAYSWNLCSLALCSTCVSRRRFMNVLYGNWVVLLRCSCDSYGVETVVTRVPIDLRPTVGSSYSGRPDTSAQHVPFGLIRRMQNCVPMVWTDFYPALSLPNCTRHTSVGRLQNIMTTRQSLCAFAANTLSPVGFPSHSARANAFVRGQCAIIMSRLVKMLSHFSTYTHKCNFNV